MELGLPETYIGVLRQRAEEARATRDNGPQPNQLGATREAQ